MTIKLNHRQVALTIGGVNYSAQSDGGELDVEFLEEAGGLCWASGVINLTSGDQPIDEDATPGLFEEGTPITLSFADTTGTLRPFPHALRCIKPTHDRGKQRLRVGDVFALGDRKPNTSFLAAQAVPGIALSSKDVIERWAAEGFDLSTFDWQTDREFFFGWPPEVKGDSYREAIGALLNALGLKGWVNALETLVIKEVTPKATAPLFSVNADTAPKQFEPVELGDRPAEKLTVLGTYNQVEERDPSVTSVSESENTSGTVVRRNTRTDAYNFNTDQRVVTDTLETDGDILYAELVAAGESAPSTSLVEERESVETWDYESSDSGKLLSISTSIKQRRITVMPGYLGWQIREADITASQWNDYLDPAEEQTVTFSYDSRERLTKRVETHEETIGAVFSALGSVFEWGDFLSLGSNFQGRQETYRLTETWSYEGKDVREYQRVEEIVAARDRDSQASIRALLEGSNPNSGQSRARDLVQRIDGETSAGGALSAPSTQRKPASQFYPEPQQLETVYNFPSFNSNWVDKEETVNMPYLPDLGAFAVPSGSTFIPPQEAMDLFGDIVGHLYKSSAKARTLEGPLFDELLTSYEPWAIVDITQGDVVRRVALDGVKFQWDSKSTRVIADCPCLGTVVNGSLVLPYNTP